MSCLFLSIIAFMHYEVSIIAIHLPSSHVSIFLSYSSISFMPHNFEFPTCSCHPMRTMSGTTSTISQLLTSFLKRDICAMGTVDVDFLVATWHGAAEGRRQRGRRRRQGSRGRGADRAAAVAAGAAALGAALRGLLWRQPRVAREGSNRETEKMEKKRNPKKDRRKKHWKLNGFRGKRRKPCCFLIKPQRIILRVVWLHFSQYHEVFHDLSTIDANTSNDDFSVEKHRSNMFNQHPCFICFTHASVCLRSFKNCPKAQRSNLLKSKLWRLENEQLPIFPRFRSEVLDSKQNDLICSLVSCLSSFVLACTRNWKTTGYRPWFCSVLRLALCAGFVAATRHMSSKIVGHEADSVDLFLMPSHAGRHVQFDGFDGETGAEALFCGGHSCWGVAGLGDQMWICRLWWMCVEKMNYLHDLKIHFVRLNRMNWSFNYCDVLHWLWCSCHLSHLTGFGGTDLPFGPHVRGSRCTEQSHIFDVHWFTKGYRL